jgi:hypothetical protein
MSSADPSAGSLTGPLKGVASALGNMFDLIFKDSVASIPE